ncbi:MAG: LPS assembly protein LptD [Deltaproteobacteria bacterium]|nr:LPS assembly protein LptD [Deltaproteobacteria bacterium]
MKNDDPDKPWNIAADELNYDQETGVYSAKGRVTISKLDRKLTADFVRFDSQNMIARAEGNVIMIVGEDILIGSSMEINLDSETGTITEGTIFIKEKHFYIRGDKIQKIGKESYAIEKASISTCDGEVPAWEVTGRDLEVTIGGYGIVKHAALRAKKIPILYSPFLIFPVKRERQTGLLPPEFGMSDRKGFEYIQPLFLAIDESSDLTLYSHFMDQRGEKVGIEYRYILDETSKGALMVDYLKDRRVDDGTPDSSDQWGYDGDNFRRNNKDRYWVRMKHDHALPYNFQVKLDIDVVSDQDYLHEFENGYTGFNETERYFNEIFNRELDDFNDPIRVNKLNVSRYWTNFSLNTEARWYDNVILRNRGWINDFTLQRLPYIGLDGLKQPVFNTPLYFDLDSEYTYIYSEDGTRGHRTDVHPRIYLPYKFGNYFTFEPSVGFRGTSWFIDEYENTGSEQSKNKSLFRGIYDVKLDLTSEIYNVYNIDGADLKGIKHTIRPRIVYDYTPYMNQNKYPLFNTSDENTNLVPLNDSINRVDGKNVVTYSITQLFTSKSEKTDESDADTEVLSKSTYNQFTRFKLEQSYNIYEEREDKKVNWENGKDQRPFSPLYAELEIRPINYFWLEGDTEWCQYDNEILTGNIGIGIEDKRNDELYVEYRYDRDNIESFYTELTLRITDALSVYNEYERNILDNRSVQLSFGVLYEAQCWSLDIGFTREEDNNKVAALVNLYGLGGFGKSTYFGKLRKTPGSYIPNEYSGYMDLYSIRPAALSTAETSPDDMAEDIDLDAAVAELEEDLLSPDEKTDESPAEETEDVEDDVKDEAVAEESGDEEIKETTVDDTEEKSLADIEETPTEDSLIVSDLGIEESVIEETKESLVNETREVLDIDYDEVKVGKLINLVGIFLFENKTAFYDPNLERTFNEDLAKSIYDEVGSNIVLLELDDADFPESAGQMPKLVSGRIDNFTLIEKGRQLGLSAIVTGSFTDIRPVREVRGRVFKNTYDAVRLVVNVEVYDTETGTKLLNEKFIRVSDIKKVDEGDFLDFDPMGPKKEINLSALNDAMQNVIVDMSETIGETLHKYPWKGYVTSIDNNRIILSSGSKIGLLPGNKLTVYDRKVIEGVGGHRYFIPGSKTGEVLITDVTADSSEAVLISGTVAKEGSSVKKR